MFHLRGTVSLQVYLTVNEKTTVRELVEILIKDLEIQFERRLALLKEAVEDNKGMVDPFLLNTDNMTRVEGFNLYIPRRATFQIKDR